MQPLMRTQPRHPRENVKSSRTVLASDRTPGEKLEEELRIAERIHRSKHRANERRFPRRARDPPPIQLGDRVRGKQAFTDRSATRAIGWREAKQERK